MSANPTERLNAALEGRYRLERELGQGGMATVYLAQDLKHNRHVALKVLKPELAAVVGAERFLAEVETTANLSHPHLLPLHDSGNADSFLYYVMPYVEGESLRDRLNRERQLPVDEAVRIATAVAGALDHAHRRSVVHRDIKPANILLQDGQPVVADFGIALAVGAAGGARLTETGLSVGTPYYMSPEQATGDTAVGPRADIYALACVTYEMLVGDPPYVGSTAQAVLGKILAGEAVPPSKARPGRLIVVITTSDLGTQGLTPVWIDREGDLDVVDPTWTFDPGDNNRGIEISPDGSRVAVNRLEADAPEDIWVKQLPRGTFYPVTREPFEDVRPKWAEDGRILYISRRGQAEDPNQQADVWIRRADGLGEPELVLDHSTNVWEVEVAPGGDWLVARVGGQVNQVGARDIVVRGPDDAEARPVIASDFDEKAIDLSPDGRWLAYESNESGRNEVYVRPFPNVDDGRFPVSQQGGTSPKWAHRTNELFFVSGSREMVAASYAVQAEAFRVTDLQVLFELPADVFYPSNENYALYDVDVDDQRFIWMRLPEVERDLELVLLDNWTAALRDSR